MSRKIQFAKQYTGLRMDKIITIRGTLRLNADDILQMNYVMEDVEIVE